MGAPSEHYRVLVKLGDGGEKKSRVAYMTGGRGSLTVLSGRCIVVLSVVRFRFRLEERGVVQSQVLVEHARARRRELCWNIITCKRG